MVKIAVIPEMFEWVEPYTCDCCKQETTKPCVEVDGGKLYCEDCMDEYVLYCDFCDTFFDIRDSKIYAVDDKCICEYCLKERWVYCK